MDDYMPHRVIRRAADRWITLGELMGFIRDAEAAGFDADAEIVAEIPGSPRQHRISAIAMEEARW